MLDTSPYLKKTYESLLFLLAINTTSQCFFKNIYYPHSTHTPICLHCCDPCSLNSPRPPGTLPPEGCKSVPMPGQHIDLSSLLHCIHWPTIFYRRKIKHIKFSHTIHFMYVPSHILGIQLPAQITPAYSLRHVRTYWLVTTRTDCCMNSSLYKALDYFNSLPIHLHPISFPLLFGKEIHSLLLNFVCSCPSHATPLIDGAINGIHPSFLSFGNVPPL